MSNDKLVVSRIMNDKVNITCQCNCGRERKREREKQALKYLQECNKNVISDNLSCNN